jgi:peptidoglycan hydrolase-like protein with peptidoglycan-binding domain
MAGVAANAMFLQSSPANTSAAKAAAERAAQKAASERQKRLSLEARPSSVPSTDPAQPQILNAPRTSARLPDPGPIPLEELEKRAPEKPPPRLAAGPGAQIAIRLARIKTDASDAETEVEGGPDTVRAVQRELNTRGYGMVQADGVPGLMTRAAIMAFEHDSKLPLTGEASEALLKRLLLGGSADAQAEGARKVRSVHAESIIRTVQQSLTTLGYQPGKADGRIGEETERAIREFEMDQGLATSGRVSAGMFARLAKAVSGVRPAATLQQAP